MGFYLSKKSLRNYQMLPLGLQKVVSKSLDIGLIDFSVVCTFRGEVEQNNLYPEKTRVKWPNSKHNKWPPEAMDLVPYINRKSSYNPLHCCVLAGIVLTVSKIEGVKLRWGGNWDMDYEPITDQDFQDLVHFEEVK